MTQSMCAVWGCVCMVVLLRLLTGKPYDNLKLQTIAAGGAFLFPQGTERRLCTSQRVIRLARSVTARCYPLITDIADHHLW